ncbi:MAG: response regulator transcription factor [Pseudolysinimonas sp.]
MSSLKKARVALVDDHELVGVALAAALEGSAKLAYVGQWTTVPALLESGEVPDVVVMDLRLADGSSPLQNSAALLGTGANVVVYTSGESPSLIRITSKAAISGMVLKSAPITELLDTLERCADGDLVLSTEWAAAIAADTGIDDAALSPRERDVLSLVAAGMSAKNVATKLGIAQPTLDVHLRRIRDKYARIGRPAEGRGDLVLRALEDGYLPMPGDRA